MTRQIKQSEAYKLPFKMVDATDGYTPETGITVTVELSKDGAAFAAASGSVTEISDGWYYLAMDATDTNTEGDLVAKFTGTGCRQVETELQVSTGDISSLQSTLTTIQSLVSGDVVLTNAVTSEGVLYLYEGKTYDGALNDKPLWTVSKDYTSHTSVKLAIWRPATATTSKATLLEVTASADNATTITADFTATFTSAISYTNSLPKISSFADSNELRHQSQVRPFERLVYDLVGVIAGEEELIESGECIVFGSGDLS